MSGDELVRIDQWIVATLTNDATVNGIISGRCYGDLAPQGSIYPFVRFAHMASRDVQGHAANRIMVDATYMVAGVHQAESYLGAVKTLTDAIDAALDLGSGSADGASIFSCTRVRPFRLAEIDSGAFQVRHAGGIYRILVQL